MSIENSNVNFIPVHSVGDPFGSLNNFHRFNTLVSHGHFSTVYFCRNLINGVKVALKKVELSQITDGKTIEDCKHEIILLQQLNHHNVIKYISHFVDNNDLYIVLELASAGDLEKMLTHFIHENKTLREKTIWKFFIQICSGLEHMHLKRIMHRDIKPANIFITKEGFIKLGDLGLSRFVGSNSLLVYSMLGTPFYMAPERIQEQHNGYDFLSDIWSLACVLYEMIALHSPFYKKNLNLNLLREKILALDYPPLPSNPYSIEIRHLIDKCLVLNPKQRPNITEIKSIAQMMNERFTAETNNKTPTPSSPTDSRCETPINNT